MNQKLYKNIALAIILACSIGMTHLQCGWKENSKITESLTVFPFATNNEMQDEYMKLWEREKKLFNSNDNSTKLCEQEIYRNDLLLFYERLFRTIIKKDIENKLEYTIALGLKIAEDGSLTMEQLPIAPHNKLILCLSLDPKDEIALKKLTELFQSRKNPSKSTDQFFPKIVLEDENTENRMITSPAIACYVAKYNEIHILKQKLLLTECRTILHEFAHMRQQVQGIEMGGSYSRPLEKQYDEYPFDIAVEIDADLQSIKDYPSPKHLLELLEKTIELRFGKIENDKYKQRLFDFYAFPYLSPRILYALTLDYFKLNGNKKYAQDATDAYTERKIFEKILIEQCMNHKITKKNICFKSCLRLVDDYELHMEKNEEETIELASKKLTTNKTISQAYNYPAGNREFFELRKNFNLIPNATYKESKMGAEEINNSTKSNKIPYNVTCYSETNDTILPFSSKDEMEKEYSRLLLQEEKIVFTKSSDEDSAPKELTKEWLANILNQPARDQYYQELILFLQRLFRYIVKQDIEKKIEYTISLGLEVTVDNGLTMKRLPLDITTGTVVQHHYQLLALLLNKNDIEKQSSIKKLFEENQSKDAEQFFPTITILNKNTKKLEPKAIAKYSVKKNEIYIREKDLTLKNCRIILREFYHRLQWAQGIEMGGFLPKPISFTTYNNCIKGLCSVKAITEAEIKSIEHYPHPKHLLTLLEQRLKDNHPSKDNYSFYSHKFPYLTTPHLYAAALKYFKLTGDPEYTDLAISSYNKRKECESDTFSHCLDLVDKNKLSFAACVKHINTELETIKTNNLFIIQKTNNSIGKLSNNHINGSAELFELKKQLNLIPK